jgi:hypothetical protein
VTTLYAVDCRRRSTVVTTHGPDIEGGMFVAPATLPRFGGDLIGADEHTGRIEAISPTGAVRLLATSDLPAGGHRRRERRDRAGGLRAEVDRAGR